jgi:hypothetical protein
LRVSVSLSGRNPRNQSPIKLEGNVTKAQSARVLVYDLALTMPVHVAAKGLRLAELEGTKPALIHLGSIILPSAALLLDPCKHRLVTRTNRSSAPEAMCTTKGRKILHFIRIEILCTKRVESFLDILDHP